VSHPVGAAHKAGWSSATSGNPSQWRAKSRRAAHPQREPWWYCKASLASNDRDNLRGHGWNRPTYKQWSNSYKSKSHFHSKFQINLGTILETWGHAIFQVLHHLSRSFCHSYTQQLIWWLQVTRQIFHLGSGGLVDSTSRASNSIPEASVLKVRSPDLPDLIDLPIKHRGPARGPREIWSMSKSTGGHLLN